MIISTLRPYFTTVRTTRRPLESTYEDRQFTRHMGEETICDLISTARGALLDRCVEFARAQGYTVPLVVRDIVKPWE